MATFVYVGKNKFGQPVKGEKVAASLEEAKRLLNRDQVVVQRIRAKGGIGALMQKFQMKAASVVELAVFTRQMSTIINSGIPLTQGLDIIADQIKNRRFKEIINGVSNDVKSGLSLEDALRKHPDAFSELYVNMAVAGEKSGNLPDILSRLAKYMEREASVKGKIKSAMTYPLVVISVAITITGFILYKVVPTFANLFKDLGAELPLPTQLVVAASDLIVNNIISDFRHGDAHWIWGEGRSPFKFDTGQQPDDPPLTDVIVTGNLVHCIGKPRYKYAVILPNGPNAPRGMHFSNNLLAPGAQGISNTELPP